MQGMVERNEDMSPDGKLRIIRQNDGDIIIGIIPGFDKDIVFGQSVEFCECGSGGGRSPKTRRALIALMKAMEEDNADRPIST